MENCQQISKPTNKIMCEIIEKYWYLSFTEYIKPTHDEIVNMNRVIWFCNISGKHIEDLEIYNAPKRDVKIIKHVFDYDSIKDEDNDNENNNNENEVNNDENSKDDNKNEDNKNEDNKTDVYQGRLTYRIYKCGHCFIDVEIIIEIFDYLNSKKKYNDKNMIEMITKYFTQCMYCDIVKYKSKYSLYFLTIIESYGTICFNDKHIIDKKNFGYLANISEIGDVFDTDGYRGH